MQNNFDDELKRESSHIVVRILRMVYRSVGPGADVDQTRGIAKIIVEKVQKALARRRLRSSTTGSGSSAGAARVKCPAAELLT